MCEPPAQGRRHPAVTDADGRTSRIPTIARLEDADAFVDARIAKGADYIKII